MPLTLTASSSALFSTWYFIEELGLLFDAGDGVSAALTQKSRKVRHIFVTHADRDHVTGLVQLHQLNATNGSPQICYPKDCGSFPALQEFLARFDPQSGPATWKGLNPGDTIAIDTAHAVLAETSDHIIGEGSQCKALRFTLQHSRRVLRQEYRHLAGPEIGRLRKELGNDAVTEEVVDSLVGYSGDASGLTAAHWPKVKVLIHECTFLEPETARRAHSDLPQVLQAARELPLEALILGHFSARYNAAEICAAIHREAAQLALPFPVHAVLPGVIARDVLKSPPVWQP